MLSGSEFLEVWFRRVWNEEDATAIDEMFAPDGLANGLGAQALVGPQDFKKFHQAVCALLSDIEISVDKSLEEGEWTSAVCTLRANSQATGKPVLITGSVMTRIESGVMREAYNHWDFTALWAQLGYLPGDSFEQGLQGQKVT